MIKEIKYQGYTATPSDYECPDGDLAAVSSLIPEDGALHVIAKPKLCHTSGVEQTPIARHNSYWIYLQPIEGYTFVKYYKSEQDRGDVVRLDINENYKAIKAIGNTLIILTSTNTRFFLYKENASPKYINLGTHIPYLPITFGLQQGLGNTHRAEFELSTASGDGPITVAEYEEVRTGERSSCTIGNSTSNVQRLTEGVMAAHNAMIQDCKDSDRFGLPFFVRYAFRLYDDSLAMQSPPVLMFPDTMPQCDVVTASYSDRKVSELKVRTSHSTAILDYAASNLSNLNNWKDIISAVEIYVSPPLYLYNPAGKIDTLLSSSSDKHLPYFSISKNNYSAKYGYVNIGTQAGVVYIMFPPKTEEEIKETIVEEGRFYRIASIPLDKLQTGRTPVPIKEGTLSALEAQEPMTDGYHEFDSHAFSGAFEYNSRMIYYNATRTSGVTSVLDASTLIAFCDQYSNSDVPGNLKIATATDADGVFRFKPGKGTALTSYYGMPVPFLFLPEPKITHINLLFLGEPPTDTGINETFATTQHSYLNGVYIYTGLHTIQQYLTGQGSISTEDTEHIFQEPNKLFLSEVNNPYLIKPTNIITINAASILAVSAATKALSQGQFGQFPLYAFSTEGVWALEVSSTGTISARQPITRDVCLSPDTVTQIDTAVLFATDRGIMMLSGSNSLCISDTLNTQDPFLISGLPGLSNCDGVSGAATVTVSFLTFIAACRILYDYVHQRIIVYNAQYSYAYSYSLKSKQWGIMPSHIIGSISAYPECLAIIADTTNNTVKKNVYDYCQEDGNENTQHSTIVVTRPLKLDAPDVLKTIDTIIQRGYFRKGHVKTILYGSRDLFHWHLIYSSKDHYLRGFRGTPYKYFRIVLLCNLNKDESIFGCTVRYTPRLLDQPR